MVSIFLKNHRLALFLALILGLIAFLPNIIIHYKLQSEGLTYHPLTAAGYFDEMIFYGPHLKEVIEGNWINDDTDLAEYANRPSLLPVLPPIILRLIFFFTNSVSAIFVWNDLLLPPISFFIIYLLGYQISKDKLYSLFFSFAVVGISIIGDVLPLEKLWLSGWEEFIKFAQPMYIARTYNYALTFIGFALSMLFLHRLLTSGRTRDKIAAAISCGLLIHLHYFYGVYIGMALVFLVIMLFIKKDYARTNDIIHILIAMAVMAIPYIIQMTRVRMAYPYWFEIAVRLETDVGRHIYLNIYKHYLLYIFLAGLLIFIGKKIAGKINTALLFASLLLAGLIGLNLQVIMGYSLMPNHWLRTNVFGLKFALLALFFWLKDFFPLLKRFFHPLVFSGLIFFIVLSITNQVAYGLNNYELFTIPKNIANSFNWLKKNTPKNSVVMTPSLVTNNYLPVYTSNKIFMGSGYRSIAPNSELEERTLLAFKIFNVDTQYLADSLDPKNLYGDVKTIPRKMGFGYTPSLIEYIYNNQFINISLDPRYNKPPMPTTIKDRLVKTYSEIDADLATIQQKYQIDYIYSGPLEKEVSHVNLDEAPNLKKIYDKDDIQIYKIIKK